MSAKIQDRIIWNEFRKGSKEALEFIYKEHYSSLYHYGVKFISDADLVKDIIQELFVELIDSGSRLSATDNIRFYLLRALRNKLTCHSRQLSKQIRMDIRSCEFSFLDSIENQLIKKEVEAKIQVQISNSIQKLSDKQQEIIYLRFYNDFSYQEIAELFDVGIQTVRNLMSRAIKSLKDNLCDEVHKYLILMLFRSRL